MNTTYTCSCLVADGYDGEHWQDCLEVRERDAWGDDRPERALAETAAAKDIDLALGCLRQIDARTRRGRKGARR